MNKTVIISSHALIVANGKDIHGTASGLTDYLKDKKINFFYIKHAIYGGKETIIESSINGKEKKIVKEKKNGAFLPLQALQEYFLTKSVLNQLKKPVDVFIAVDPLNALYGIFAKRQKKVQHVIFYTADYAIKRFQNPLLNRVYHFIDRFAISNADQIWNVSTRITTLRKQQGVPDDRNFFVPNAPFYKKIKRYPVSKIHKHELVTVTTQATAVNFMAVFVMIKNLKKKYPDIHLKVIGAGDWSSNFQPDLKRLNIEKNITFIGPMSHTHLLRLLTKSAVGLALYNDFRSWAEYSDSMKARDFLACGLPVLITSNTSTADDIKKANAGFIVTAQAKELTKVVSSIFGNDSFYVQLRKNALSLAKEHDINGHFDRRLKVLGIK